MTTPVPSPNLSPDDSGDLVTGYLADSSDGIGPIRRVAIIGLGLIGGSLARDLAKVTDLVLLGWDADAGTRGQAEAAGILVAGTMAECVAGEPDLIVLAVPLAAMASVCRDLSPLVNGRTLVTDVGSVKAPVREIMETEGLAQRYLGSHPMAGTEASGFTATVEDLFHDAAWILTVVAPNEEATFSGSASGRAPAAVSSKAIAIDPVAELNAVLAITELVTRTLHVRVYVMTDDQHDETVALISHLPHVFAAELLGQVALSPGRGLALALAAGSFRDGTRVAGTNPARTEAMVVGNAAWVAPLVEQTVTRLQSLAAQLRAGGDVASFFAPGASLPHSAQVQETTPTPETLNAAGLTWPGLRTRLLDAAVHGRAIRAVDLRTQMLSLAP